MPHRVNSGAAPPGVVAFRTGTPTAYNGTAHPDTIPRSTQEAT
ncbi:hypothetical protein YT1_0062 [Rhodococcus ruber]|nr:hypothetical protein YT1_0062 [Rhodococcus ruber]